MAPHGHIKISRKAYADDPFWNEKRAFSKWEAWEWMIQAAAWKDTSRVVGMGVVRLQRGEFLASLRYLAEAWNWKKDRVHEFLRLLVEMERLSRQREEVAGTVYLLVNYGSYQNTITGDQTPGQTATRQGADSNPTGSRQSRSSKAVKAEETEETLLPDRNDTGRARSEYPADFEITWALYPRRSGDNPKKAAHRAWAATLKRGATPEQLQTATLHYAAHVISNGRAGTEYVKLASTFYGPDEPWRDYLEAPPARSTGSSNPWVMPYTPPTPEEIEADANTVTRSMAEFRRQREAGRGAA